MGYVDDLLKSYSRFVQIPWDKSLAGPQRVWMAVYSPEQERRLRIRVGDFENATRESGHGWRRVRQVNNGFHVGGINRFPVARLSQQYDVPTMGTGERVTHSDVRVVFRL